MANDHRPLPDPKKNDPQSWLAYEDAAKERYGSELAYRRFIEIDDPQHAFADWRMVRTLMLGIGFGLILFLIALIIVAAMFGGSVNFGS